MQQLIDGSSSIRGCETTPHRFSKDKCVTLEETLTSLVFIYFSWKTDSQKIATERQLLQASVSNYSVNSEIIRRYVWAY